MVFIFCHGRGEIPPTPPPIAPPVLDEGLLLRHPDLVPQPIHARMFQNHSNISLVCLKDKQKHEKNSLHFIFFTFTYPMFLCHSKTTYHRITLEKNAKQSSRRMLKRGETPQRRSATPQANMFKAMNELVRLHFADQGKLLISSNVMPPNKSTV